MRIYQLIYAESFWKDTEDVLLWYNDISLETFLQCENEIQNALNRIRKNPFSNSIVTKRNCRRVLLKNYPYKIYYRVNENFVEVLALIHTSRSQKFIKTKLK